MKPAALVLAGSRPGPPDPVAASEGVWHKALVEIEGQTMLARVVDALRTAEIDRIAVLASDPKVMDHARELGCEVLLAAAGPSASVAIGLEKLGAPLLVTTSDHALLRPEWVRDFITDTPAETDVAVLLARREAIETAMPDSKRTYLRFADGQWSGCNLFLLASEQAGKAIDTWKMVGMLVSYAIGRLTLAEAIAGLGRRIGVNASLVAARDGLAAVDVDKPKDLADARAIIAARAPAQAPVTCTSSPPGST